MRDCERIYTSDLVMRSCRLPIILANSAEGQFPCVLSGSVMMIRVLVLSATTLPLLGAFLVVDQPRRYHSA